MRIKYTRKRLFFVMHRSLQVRTQEGDDSPRKIFVPTGKLSWTYFKTIGHSFKKLSPLRKLFSPPGVPNWLRAWKSSKRLDFLLPC